MRRYLPQITLLISLCLCASCRPGVSNGGPTTAKGESGRHGLSAAPLSLPEEIKLLRRAGLPTSPEELQPALPPPDKNAAPLYRQLAALVKTKPVSEADKIAVEGHGDGVLKPEAARRLTEALQHRADIGELVHKAALRPKCVFDRDWSVGPAAPFPEADAVRLAARWLSAESALQLYRGETLSAVKTAALGFRLGAHMAQSTDLVPYLVANATDATTLGAMKRILYAAGDRPGVAAAVQHAVETEWRPHSLARALQGEVILPLVELEKDRKAGPAAYEKALAADRRQGVPETARLTEDDRSHWDRFVDRRKAAALRIVRETAAVADRPYSEASLALASVSSELDTHRQDPAFLSAAEVFPVYEQAVKKHAQLQARVATVEAAAAALNWKAGHGSLPPSLASAMPRPPADPFDGRPLRYKREGNGFLVYSVGPTGKFDGGTAAVKSDALETVFRYLQAGGR